jgi:acetyl esterase/lipase
MIDPRLFHPDAVAPETARFREEAEKLLASQPPITEFAPEYIRAAREQGGSIWGDVVTVEAAQTRNLPGPAGGIPVRLFVPPGEVRGVYLHVHGGGWVLGAAHHSDIPNWALARHCRVAVLSVDYRLAPEHPFPAGPDDCEAAALWLLEHAAAEFGTDTLLIGGESAGAHLSLVTLLRMRDRHGFDGFAGANLVYGMYDLDMTPSVRRWGSRNLILSTPTIEWFLDHAVPRLEERSHPDFSPLRAELSGLPPAHFTVGTLDPLLDDTLFMHARWLAAGREASLFVAPGGIHAFDQFPIPLAKRARAEAERFIDRALGAN